jgi:hypothetical protein
MMKMAAFIKIHPKLNIKHKIFVKEKLKINLEE